jgi:hypothetical protein
MPAETEIAVEFKYETLAKLLFTLGFYREISISEFTTIAVAIFDQIAEQAEFSSTAQGWPKGSIDITALREISNELASSAGIQVSPSTYAQRIRKVLDAGCITPPNPNWPKNDE